MWGQRNSKYAAAVGIQLLAKIHVLDDKIGRVDRQQNHPVDRLEERLDIVGDVADRVGQVVDELNQRIDVQDVQIQQLANMVNDLVGKVENQANEIKGLKRGKEEHRKVINNLTVKLIAVEECLEDVQKKAFPRVRESGVDNDLVIDNVPPSRLQLSSLVRLRLRHPNRWLLLLFVVNAPPVELVLFVEPTIVESNDKVSDPPARR
jgi:hypothetical protein